MKSSSASISRMSSLFFRAKPMVCTQLSSSSSFAPRAISALAQSSDSATEGFLETFSLCLSQATARATWAARTLSRPGSFEVSMAISFSMPGYSR